MSELKRSVKVAQLLMREVQCEISGTAGTPIASGFDKNQIKSVVDNGTGDYTIILKRPFNNANPNKAKAFVQCLTAARVATVSAVAFDRVSILVTDLSGTAADADISVLIKGCDHRFNY